jgi:chromosome segregation protein
MFRFKPSPFCVLDEVDAPLDEANVDRFANMVRETERSDSVHRHHPQQANNGDRFHALWRYDGGARYFQNRFR